MNELNKNSWIDLVANNESLLQGDNIPSNQYIDFEDILKLSLQMITTDTTSLDELKILGELTILSYPKIGSAMDFHFYTRQKIHTVVKVNSETKEIRYIRITPESAIDKNNLPADNIVFIKNEFLIYDEDNFGEICYSYHINQKYHLKNNTKIIIEFWKDYSDNEKDLFEYFKKNTDELHLFSEVALYRE